MKNKKTTLFTICIVFLFVALIGVAAFCIHQKNRENNKTTEADSSLENTETDELASKESSSETTDTTIPETTPEPTPEPLALNMVQAELQRKYHNDELTATLLEKEYFYEVSETRTNDAFEVNLIGFTGDVLTPMILMDVTVKDETLLSEEDRIFVDLYCLGTTQYETQKDSYVTVQAYGVRDSENSNLFHISTRGASTWMAYGEEFVIDINYISIGSGESRNYSWDEYDVNMEYRMTVPTSTFKPTYSFGYDHNLFDFDGLTFELAIITPSYYFTELYFNIDYSKSDLVGMEKGELLSALSIAADDFVKDLILTANGKEYIGDPETTTSVRLNGDTAYFYTNFPGIDAKLLYSMTIEHGETNYTLQ